MPGMLYQPTVHPLLRVTAFSLFFVCLAGRTRGSITFFCHGRNGGDRKNNAFGSKPYTLVELLKLSSDFKVRDYTPAFADVTVSDNFAVAVIFRKAESGHGNGKPLPFPPSRPIPPPPPPSPSSPLAFHASRRKKSILERRTGSILDMAVLRRRRTAAVYCEPKSSGGQPLLCREKKDDGGGRTGVGLLEKTRQTKFPLYPIY